MNRAAPRLPRLLGLPLLAFVLLPLLAPLPARAEDWAQARDAFQKAQKEADWKLRRDAFVGLANHDSAEAVSTVLDALEKESNAAVVLAGLDTLALFRSLGARQALLEQARKASGRSRLLVLLALEQQPGPEIEALLLEVAAGKDAAAACQAVLALGAEPRPAAVPLLVKLLKDGDWQVRAAAARVLGRWKAEDALAPLAAALGSAKGRDRGDIVTALEAISGQAYGNDPAAWKKLASGQDPASIEAKPDVPPSAFGVPIYGRRVVICLDSSLRMGDPHPFDRERLQALCEPPDGAPIPWFRIKTNLQFAHAHVKHLVDGLPKGTRFELLLFNERVIEVFGGFTSAGAAARKTVEETLDTLQTDNGIATYPVLDRALDLGGGNDKAAWRSGPDEIVFVTVNVPTIGEVTEATAVGAAIALKARLRMVPVHTVGLHFHPYDMCRQIAERTGGTYVNLVK